MTHWNFENRFFRLFAITFILLVAFASRAQFLTDTPLHVDEARTGMRIMGTPAEVIAWQPPDWPPLHNLLLSSWTYVAGEYPFSLRTFSALMSLLSVAIAYPMAYRLTHNRNIALGTMITYAALGMSVYLGIFIRGYAQVMALFPLAILLTARYFEMHKIRDAFGLAFTMGLMFVSTYTTVIAFAFLGLLTLLRYARQLGRWVIVGLFASPFALIEILRKWEFWFDRVSPNSGGYHPTRYPINTMVDHYREYVGQAEVLWLCLGIVALVLLIWKGREYNRLLLWILIACIFAPLITLFLVESRIFILMTTRYSWWVLIILSLGFALGLRYLPKILWMATMLVMVGLMVTLPMREIYYSEPLYSEFFEDNFEWLREQSLPGDVLMFDPKFCTGICNNRDEIALYWDIYLDDKVTWVDSPGDYRRIWLWRGIGHSRELLEELEETHIPSLFFGPPTSLLELYVAPPDPEGILYENGMRFHGFDIMQDNGRYDYPPYDLRERTTVQVRLWWSADEPIDEDYQVSLQIQNMVNQQIVTQHDGAPNLIHLKPNAFEPLPSTTQDWIPNQLYVDLRTLEIPNTFSEIRSKIVLIIYTLPDGTRIPTIEKPSDGVLPLSETVVWGWG